MKLLLAVLKEMSGAPTEFQVLPNGKIDINGDEPAFIDEASALGLIERFKKRGNDMVIDYEHQTLEGVQAPAAGWVKNIEWRGEQGLWLTVEWTKRAQEYLANREYRYFSPVLAISKAGRKVLELINVALTNSPAINNLQPIVAKYDADKNQPTKEEGLMIEKLKKLLGLAADAGEDKIIEAVTLSINKVKELTEQAANVVACKDVLDAIGAEAGATKEKVLTIVAGLKAPADAAQQLSLKVAELTQKIAAMEQTDLVQLALSEGKISPDELEKWGKNLALTNPESFKLIVLSRPAYSVIPLADIQKGKETTGGTGGLDDAQRSINKMCGVSDETYLKYHKQ